MYGAAALVGAYDMVPARWLAGGTGGTGGLLTEDGLLALHCYCYLGSGPLI